MEERKFRLKLNLFDGVVILLAAAAALFLLWRAARPEVPVQPDPETTATIRYTVRIQRWEPGTSGLIREGDQISDNIKNYEVGRVVSAQAVPAQSLVLDIPNQRFVRTEIDGLEDVLLTIEAPCVVTDTAIVVGGGYEVRVGAAVYLRGEGYMGSGPIIAIEEVRG